MNTEICVYVVDDHPIVREGIRRILEQHPSIIAIREAANRAETMKLLQEKCPEILLMDISLKSDNGLTLIKDILALYPKLPIIVVSMHDEALYAERALRAGARGYIMKEEAKNTIIKAITEVLGGELYVSDNFKDNLLHRMSTGSTPSQTYNQLEKLTDRELEVLLLLGRGLTTTVMAKSLNVSPKTIETHRVKIKNKLNIESLPELLRFAVSCYEMDGLKNKQI